MTGCPTCVILQRALQLQGNITLISSNPHVSISTIACMQFGLFVLFDFNSRVFIFMRNMTASKPGGLWFSLHVYIGSGERKLNKCKSAITNNATKLSPSTSFMECIRVPHTWCRSRHILGCQPTGHWLGSTVLEYKQTSLTDRDNPMTFTICHAGSKSGHGDDLCYRIVIKRASRYVRLPS